MNIIFVCTGNTCRSPMAEGYAKSVLDKVNVLSRGLMVYDGSKVTLEAVIVLKNNDIDISNHIPKQLSLDDIASADLIFTMTRAHSEYLKNIFQNDADKIFPLSEYTATKDISDPFGSDVTVYTECFNDIKNAVDVLRMKICHE